MSIEYTYEIILVDQDARSMEVVYTAQGRDPLHVSMRLPFENETVDSIVAMYSPVRYWEEKEATVIVPEVGRTGTHSPTAPAETVQQRIEALERANPITHRNLRDLAMAVAAIGELVTGQPAANLPMVQAISALEEQIALLRGQM